MGTEVREQSSYFYHQPTTGRGLTFIKHLLWHQEALPEVGVGPGCLEPVGRSHRRLSRPGTEEDSPGTGVV